MLTNYFNNRVSIKFGFVYLFLIASFNLRAEELSNGKPSSEGLSSGGLNSGGPKNRGELINSGELNSEVLGDSELSTTTLKNKVDNRKLGQNPVLVEIKRSYLGVKSVQFINANSLNTSLKSSEYFEGRIFRKADKISYFSGLDIFGQFARSQNELSQFTINEAYFVATMGKDEITFIVGRRKSTWSLLDDQWKIGSFQPVFKVDPLNAETQGFTGVFVDISGKNWSMELFASPLFIPDQGPQIEIEKGAFVKKVPWFYYPPSDIRFNDVLTPVNYTLDRQSDHEIISKKSFGAKLELGKFGENGFSGRLAWSNKPMNQLLLGLNGFLKVSGSQVESENNRIEANLRPEVGYHNLKSIDLSYKLNQWIFSLSALEDSPLKHDFAPKWTYQNHRLSQLLGGSIEFVSDSGFKFITNYIKREGGESQVYGLEKDLVGHFIPERYSFLELANLNLTHQKKLSSRLRIESTGEWTRELNEGSELLTLKGALLFSIDWKAYFGLNLLKTENRNKDRKDFIEANLANDRVYGGIQYVF